MKDTNLEVSWINGRAILHGLLDGEEFERELTSGEREVVWGINQRHLDAQQAFFLKCATAT